MQERRPAPLYTRVLVRKGCVTVHLEGLQVTIKKQQALICSLPGSSSLQQAVAPNPEDPAVKDLVSRLKIGAFVEGWELSFPCIGNHKKLKARTNNPLPNTMLPWASTLLSANLNL